MSLISGDMEFSYSSADNNWHEILHFMADGKLKPETLITHRFGLKDCEALRFSMIRRLFQ